MPIHQVVLKGKGPLPISNTFTPQGSTEAVDFFVSGSAFAPSKNKMLSVEVHIDGQLIGLAKVFANAPESHLTLASGFYQLKEGITGEPHTITLKPQSNVNTNANDAFTVVMIY